MPFTSDLKKIKNILNIGDERTLKNYLRYLERGGIIIRLARQGKSVSALEKPEKVFLHNSNLMYTIASKENIQKGSIRETFFINALTTNCQVNITNKGDFIVNGKYIFEIGGTGKSFRQINNLENSYFALDEIETEIGAKIPLWLFGFLY